MLQSESSHHQEPLPSVVIDPDLVSEAKAVVKSAEEQEKMFKDEKRIFEEELGEKDIEEVSAIIKDKNSQTHKLLKERSPNEYKNALGNIELIRGSVQGSGLLSPEAIVCLNNLPSENEFRYIVREAAARQMWKMGFEHFKTIKEIISALDQLKEYMHAGEARDLDLTNVTEAVKILEYMKESDQPISSDIPVFQNVTREAGLKAAVAKCLGVEV